MIAMSPNPDGTWSVVLEVTGLKDQGQAEKVAEVIAKWMEASGGVVQRTGQETLQ